ncbi:MAG: hypothetical protein K1X72_22685 [Pyrinomonadaceae bacterium]|nr:hypothetical protein [Pyrinomonadaceae bacterium]
MPIKDKEKRREYQKEYMRKWYEKNKAKHISYVRARDKKILTWLKEYKSSLQCEKCGENHPACLEFHHIDPKEKKFSLGRAKSHLTIKSLKAEIAKCKLLCANCHRKEHWEEKEKEQNAP